MRKKYFCLATVLGLSFFLSVTESSWSASPIPKKPIRVYDANRQFLGILVDKSHVHERGGSKIYETMNIFIPSLSKFALIFPSNEEDGYVWGSDYHGGNPDFYFETTDCTGAPYIIASFYSQYEVHAFFKENTFKYFTVNESGSVQKHIHSCYRNSVPDLTGCFQTDNSWLVIAFKEVTLPFNVPFAYPLRFEYK